jgi:hypothetical protein
LLNTSILNYSLIALCIKEMLVYAVFDSMSTVFSHFG